MPFLLSRVTAATLLFAAGLAVADPARAQVATVPSDPAAPGAPSTTTPNAVTPPGGVARGVIRPNRPVDSGMVKPPPTSNQHKMPVIQPPGTAR